MSVNNRAFGTMVELEPPQAEVEYIEKDPTGRYVRVFCNALPYFCELPLFWIGVVYIMINVVENFV